MRARFAAALRCPHCGRDGSLTLVAESSDAREVREGTLTCGHCGARRPVHRGVAELMADPPDHVQREAEGLGRFAEVMRADGWTPERIRELPHVQDGYWYVQATSINQLLAEIPFVPGQSLLDIGSNTCWASNYFAVRGLEVVALDISLWEMQGLWTADYFIAEGTSYFERVLGSMNEMPLASGSLDYVYACEVLHHNDPDGLVKTFAEAYRVLKPGGKMLVVNETLKTWHDRSGVHVDAVAQFEGYEHAHWALQYRAAALRAGFSTALLEPPYHMYFQYPSEPAPPLRDWRGRLVHELRLRRRGRRVLLEWVNDVEGKVGFGMIATKPLRARHTPQAAARRLRDEVRGPRRRAARSG